MKWICLRKVDTDEPADTFSAKSCIQSWYLTFLMTSRLNTQNMFQTGYLTILVKASSKDRKTILLFGFILEDAFFTTKLHLCHTSIIGIARTYKVGENLDFRQL